MDRLTTACSERRCAPPVMLGVRRLLFMKSVVLFVLMLVLFAAGAYVVGASEGSTTWVEVALVTVGFGVWQVWKRIQRSKQAGDRKKLGAA